MTETVIHAERVGKSYWIGSRVSLPQRLRRSLQGWFRGWRCGETTDGIEAATAQEFWALRDVSFSIDRGQVVGVIGRNGAGKSTLFKILSRITEPTTGQVLIHGRVTSLLEIGTGFHPELTGRENIFMNGSILGMKRTEILRKLDEIIAFAEIDQFLDTPIKRYSSGMYTRLAFAVAAHLDADILILDEVLAVGDGGFQQKCLGKMGEVARDGRTVLFVSHNLGSVLSQCNRCLLLDKGRLIREGSTAEVAAYYQHSFHQKPADPADLRQAPRFGHGKARFTQALIYSPGAGGERHAYLISGRDLCLDLLVEAYERVNGANVAIVINSTTGERLIDANLMMQGNSLFLEPGETAQIRFHLQNVLLKPGVYDVAIWMGRTDDHFDGIWCVHSFNVELDPTQPQNVAFFPAYYACRFSHCIERKSPVTFHDKMEKSQPSISGQFLGTEGANAA